MNDRQTLTNISLGIFGAVCCLLGLGLYAGKGFSSYLTLFWLVGCAALLSAAFRVSAKRVMSREEGERSPRIGKTDWLIAGAIMLVFTPLYLINVHDFPRQMNTDEISIMSTAKTLSTAAKVDIFAPSYYSDLPAFIFWFLGKIGVSMGGVTLGHMRLIHAMSGVLIIVLCYFLLRLLALPRFAAVAGTAAIGLCHSMFFIARLAMRDNTAVLFELITLILLLVGWRRKHFGWTLLGGLMGGLTFYTYYPSRITIAIWLAFIFLISVRDRFADWRTAGKLAATMLAGVTIIAAPLFIATAKHTPTDPYASHQFLWQKEARQQEKEYRGTATEAAAIKINIEHGLASFNKPYTDQGMMYYHPGYGFLDMITGIILWVGVAALLIDIYLRRRITDSELLALTGFLTIWLSLSFLLTRAPDYTRLLTVLPFVGYMIGRAVMGMSEIGVPGLKKGPWLRRWPWILTGLLILIIGLSNFVIAKDFWKQGNLTGDGTGDTLRFEEKHTNEYAQWLFVPGVKTQYYSWGIPSYWQFWLDFGKSDGQPLVTASSQDLQANRVASLQPGQQGYLLTTGDVWQADEAAFRANWQVQDVYWLDAAHNRVAVSYVPKS